MATQFASFTPTVRFPAPRQSVRIAYSSQSSLGAIADALTEQPTPVVEATLEELAARTPLRELLAERNALCAGLNADTTGGDAVLVHVCKRIATLDRQVITGEAHTPDDAVMKLLALAQVAADQELIEGEAESAVASARQFFGIGYLSSLPEDSEADVSDEAALDRINQLDALIAATPASSADDMIAKLVLATQVHAEGMDLPVSRAAALVREAKAHLGMGYVFSAEVAA